MSEVALKNLTIKNSGETAQVSLTCDTAGNLLKNGTVLGSLQDGEVTTNKLASAAVTSTKLATTTAERDWVLARTATADAGSVGTYALLSTLGTNTTTYDIGSTLAGSSLRFSGLRLNNGAMVTEGVKVTVSATIPSGTWRCMSYQPPRGVDDFSVGKSIYNSQEPSATLWLRIA